MTNKTRIKWRRDNIIRPVLRALTAISSRHIVRHIFSCQSSQSLSCCNLHCLINTARMNIKRPAENIREPKHIIHLVRVIRSPCRDNRIGANFSHLFWCNFRVRIGHRKNNWLRRHRLHHILAHKSGC